MASKLLVTWRVLLEDDKWNQEPDSPLPVPSPREPQASRRTLNRWQIAVTAACVVLVIALGVGLWLRAQAGLTQVEEDLSATVALETQMQATGDDLRRASLVDSQADPRWRKRFLASLSTEPSAEQDNVGILWFDLQDDQAMVAVRVTPADGRAPFREVRFYRETAAGWLRTSPDLSFWGEPRTLESEFFVFYFRQRDQAAVAEAALLLDARYRAMREAIGLSPAGLPSEGARIPVSINRADLFLEDANPLWAMSPLQRTLPMDVTDAAYLAEFLSFPMRSRFAVDLLQAHSCFGDFMPTSEFLNGLTLWLSWETDGAFSHHRFELVRWLFEDAPQLPTHTPPSYQVICQDLDGWGFNTALTSLPFHCTDPNLLGTLPFRAPTSLRHLPLAIDLETTGQMPGAANVELLSYRLGLFQMMDSRLLLQRSRAYAFATVFAYAQSQYGPQSVARLIYAAADGASWMEASPLVFDVSAGEFEEGWRAYLAETYDVDISHFEE